MTQLQEETLPVSLADMLPVGMIASGGAAATAMALVAQRKRSQAGWEAFHYERASSTEFDITGGIAVHAANATQGKKWQEPHDAIRVTEAEILHELQQMQQREAHTSSLQTLPPLPPQPQLQQGTQAAPQPAIKAFSEVSTNMVQSTSASAQQYLQVVLALPDDEVGRQRIMRAFQLQADFFGAKVKACSIHDAHPITII
ncbi:hypothetical protein ACO0LB_03325 [Undibacterium sp. SXout7W]|uniref:hypothetical protein n=1 Tax=Undibacterium sp. SXout7W TaxID=3413049 RepID=UPI003BF077B1